MLSPLYQPHGHGCLPLLNQPRGHHDDAGCAAGRQGRPTAEDDVAKEVCGAHDWRVASDALQGSRTHICDVLTFGQ